MYMCVYSKRVRTHIHNVILCRCCVFLLFLLHKSLIVISVSERSDEHTNISR